MVSSEMGLSARWVLAGGIRDPRAADDERPLWEEDRCESDVLGLDGGFEVILVEAWERVRLVDEEVRGWRK